MARPKSIYRRLTGRYRTLLGYSQLWIAPDHLLLLKSSRIAEEYRRFAFSDIQAVVVTELADSQVAQFVGILAALLWTALALTVSSTFARGFFLISGLWLVVLAVMNLVRGQRCRCHLYTAVSRELLTPVRRVRTARAFLAKLRPEIEAAQGSLSIDSEILTAPAAAVESSIDRPPGVPKPAVGYVMEILFGLILLDAILILAAQRFQILGTPLSSLLPTAFFTEIVLAIFVLVRRENHDPRRAAFVITAVSLACMLVDAFTVGSSAAVWFRDAFDAAQRGVQANPPQFQLNPPAAWTYFATGWRVLIGAAGLMVSRMERAAGAKGA